MGDLTKNFDRSEFACKDNCGFDKISPKLVALLQYIRSATGIPFVIQSGCRCEAYNKKVGGVKDSAHTKGLAVDILCPNSRDRYHMLKEFMVAFKRIGIGASFIHVDIDESLDPEVTWLY